MATIDPMTKFAEQAMGVERVLQQARITANPGRVIFVLTVANTKSGVSQKEVVEATALRKDVVSKFIRSLVQAGVLTRKRESKMNRLSTSDSGRKLLLRVRASLSPRSAGTVGKKRPKQSSMFDKDGNVVAVEQL
jgi:DNA-binding MarR family transcriptional regulator